MTETANLAAAREAYRWFQEFAALAPADGSGDARVPSLVKHLGVVLAELDERDRIIRQYEHLSEKRMKEADR